MSELLVVVAATIAVAAWTLNPALALLPAVFYLASRRGGRCVGRARG